VAIAPSGRIGTGMIAFKSHFLDFPTCDLPLTAPRRQKVMGHISRGGEDLEDREDARRRLADDGVERPGTPFHTIIGTRNRDRNIRARKCQPLLSLSGETASRPPACWGHIDGERKFSCCGFYLLVSNAGVQNANACGHCKQELMVKASMQAYLVDSRLHTCKCGRIL
jgi:hypothetical protein